MIVCVVWCVVLRVRFMATVTEALQTIKPRTPAALSTFRVASAGIHERVYSVLTNCTAR